MPQLAGLFTGAALQFLIAEVLLGPGLGGDHIGLIDGIASAAGQSQKGTQLQWLGQLGLQGWITASRRHKGIQLLEAQNGRFS